MEYGIALVGWAVLGALAFYVFDSGKQLWMGVDRDDAE